MTYARIKKLITNGNYNKDMVMNQLDVFLIAQRITTEQYNELTDLMA